MGPLRSVGTSQGGTLLQGRGSGWGTWPEVLWGRGAVACGQPGRQAALKVGGGAACAPW